MVLYRAQRIHLITGWLYFVGERCFAEAQHDVLFRIVNVLVLAGLMCYGEIPHDVGDGVNM